VGFPPALEPVSVGAIVYLGSVVTFGAYGCYNFGVSRIPAGQAAAFINLIPVLSLVMGTVILGETLSVAQYLASGIIFLGIFLSQQRERRTAEAGIPAE
jgi:drug/metabolite transporter (DMT)-like permease